jgi:serine/threonine protein kinase
MKTPATQFADALDRLRLLKPNQLTEFRQDVLPRFPDFAALGRELLRRGWLTAYQIDQIHRGHSPVLGHYVLMEALGESGMGQVFKARHRHLGRVAALEVLREDVQNEGRLSRFLRDAEAAARLNHPNVVHAYDAGEAAGRHFLALEYVEGPDLGTVVRQRGPLPVAQACDYVRQAALGLQHALEKGLVHRHLKPSHLLLEEGKGLVKVSGLGRTGLGDGPRDGAPEQAAGSGAGGVRADLYSLGCTLYFLLAGRPLFAEGSAREKFLRHTPCETPALEGLRPGVPPGVSALVRRLTANRPGDRFQTPAEVASALSEDVQSVRPPEPAPARTPHPAHPSGVPRAAGSAGQVGRFPTTPCGTVSSPLFLPWSLPDDRSSDGPRARCAGAGGGR